MSFAEWKEQASQLGMNAKETKEYILCRQKEHAQALECEKEREREAHDLELQKMRDDREKEKEAHELQMAQLQVAANGQGNVSLSSQATVQLPRLKLAPFKTTDRIEVFIARFEEAADVMQFDETAKRLQFMSLFEGQALEVIHRLDDQERDYVHMKDALLAAYGKSVDELKRQFFSASLGDEETPVQYATRLKAYLEQWRRKDGAADTAAGIKDLFLRAQFLQSCPEQLVARLKIDKVNSLDEMKEIADAYFEACGREKTCDSESPEPPLFQDDPEEVSCRRAPGEYTDDFPASRQRRGYSGPSDRVRSRQAEQPRGRRQEERIKTSHPFGRPWNIAGGVTDSRDSLLIKGKGTVSGKEVTVMRDNGSTVCILRRCLASAHEYTGSVLHLRLIDGSMAEAPEVRVRVKTPFYSGWITAAALDTPICDLIIGNISGVVDSFSRDAVTQTAAAAVRISGVGKGAEKREIYYAAGVVEAHGSTAMLNPTRRCYYRRSASSRRRLRFLPHIAAECTREAVRDRQALLKLVRSHFSLVSTM